VDAIQRNLKQHNLVSPLPDSVHLLGNFFIPMKEIQLTQGKVALVDDADYEYLNQWKWHFKTNGNNFYAVRTVKSIDGKYGKKIILHRFLLNITNSSLHIDHINNNSLDNRKINLRVCTRDENLRNRKVNLNNKSGYKGVYWSKAGKKWASSIGINKKIIYLGLFTNPKEAARAYNAAAIKLHGEFAKLNEI
jgi:hypothetical protein